MNKRIFVTLAAVIITGTVLYKMPSRAGGDTETPVARPRLPRRPSFDKSSDSVQGVKRFGGSGGYLSALSQERALSSNIEHFAQQQREKRAQITRDRIAIVKENLKLSLPNANTSLLENIFYRFSEIIQFLEEDYLDLFAQLTDEREWANTLYNINMMYRRQTDTKIEALEKRVADLEAAASAPTEY